MIAVVTGSRHLKIGNVIKRELDRLQPSLVIHGGADGADSWAHRWAIESCCPVLVVPADWDRHGRRAGTIRNEFMLMITEQIARPRSTKVVVLAFPLDPAPGTRGCMKLAIGRGFDVREFDPLETP